MLATRYFKRFLLAACALFALAAAAVPQGAYAADLQDFNPRPALNAPDAPAVATRAEVRNTAPAKAPPPILAAPARAPVAAYRWDFAPAPGPTTAVVDCATERGPPRRD